ncbi:PAS domain S-box protein [Pseudaminobacter arsenicus]|uniref:PAS domain S-box protein n=1 Tax=Borborobacter arsenicus TaxID=1851146 RepID=A0A432V4J6_9HYPH|nr:PAS domain S-box protein [Pseudaminobacter arsenicus]RUM97144.1 PAS domain S-box protein [Pseudaminobacter arsenicus]
MTDESSRPANVSTTPLTREEIATGILDSAANAIVVSDQTGTIVLWNAGAERVFGFAEHEALGKSLDIIIPEPLRARHWEGYRQTMRSGTSRYGAGDVLSVPGLHKDGHRISVEFTITLLVGAGAEIRGMVAVMTDVTKRFEELKSLRKKLTSQALSSA